MLSFANLEGSGNGPKRLDRQDDGEHHQQDEITKKILR